MKIYTRKVASSYIIKLSGELDACTAESVEEVLDQVILLNPAEIQVDCTDLKYISSRGLGVFISRFQDIQQKQIGFFLYNLNNQVFYVFQVLGLDSLLDLRPAQVVNA